MECKFLNAFNLADNKISGSIPTQLSRLGCLNRLSLADNGLSGSIPSELSRFGEDDFSGNNGLCGKPLSGYGPLNGRNLTIIVVARIIGAVGSLFVGFAIFWWFFIREGSRKKRGYGPGKSKDDSDWISLLRSHKLVQAPSVPEIPAVSPLRFQSQSRLSRMSVSQTRKRPKLM